MTLPQRKSAANAHNVYFSHANEILHIQKLCLLSVIHGQLKSIKVGSDIYLMSLHGGDITLGTTVVNNVWKREALFSFPHANENDRA